MNSSSLSALQTAPAPARRVRFWIGLVLVALTIAVFSGSIAHEFINYDDPEVIPNQKMVRRGVSGAGLIWAFGHRAIGHWDPLTTISHQVTCEIFGLNPGGHHLVNVLLHALGALLLFHAMRSLTGTFWRSVLVAALFALHPLRVESVAWVTERKDVLSGIFFMLTLWSYSYYCQKRTIGRYLVVGGVFAMGLMSKSMLVTTPFVLLLLDYWPLRNFDVPRSDWFRTGLKRFAEKLPLLALSAASAFIQVKSVTGFIQEMPLSVRLSNAAVCYVEYLGKTFWPSGLAAFYPHPGSISWTSAIWSGALLLTITVGAVVLRRKHPYLITGWLWFIGVLVPVIGLIQVGAQSMADRYTYLPSIGFLIMLVWGSAEVCRRWQLRPLHCGALALLPVLLCAGLSVRQMRYWANSETLFRHTIEVTPENHFAHFLLAKRLAEFPERLPEAVSEYEQVLRIVPDLADGHLCLGIVLSKIPGRSADAIAQFNRAIQLQPNLARAYYLIGCILAERPGNMEQAISAFEQAAIKDPEDALALNNLGNALGNFPERSAEAIAALQRAVKIDPDLAEAHGNLGGAYLKQPDRIPAAIEELRQAVRLNPKLASAHYNLGLAYSLIIGGDGAALQHYEAALKLQPGLESARQAIQKLRAQISESK